MYACITAVYNLTRILWIPLYLRTDTYILLYLYISYKTILKYIYTILLYDMIYRHICLPLSYTITRRQRNDGMC